MKYKKSYLRLQKGEGVWGRGAGKQKVFQVTDVMKHSPVVSIIFNSYKSMLQNATGEQKRFLKKMGCEKYHKLVMDMMKKNQIPKLMDACVQCKHCRTSLT